MFDSPRCRFLAGDAVRDDCDVATASRLRRLEEDVIVLLTGSCRLLSSMRLASTLVFIVYVILVSERENVCLYVDEYPVWMKFLRSFC